MPSNATAFTEFDQLWDYSKPRETELKFRALLPEAEVSGDLEYLLQLQTQIARTQGLQRQFQEAHKTLDDVQNRLTSKTPVSEIRYFLERGRCFNSAKEKDRALPLFRTAFDNAMARGEDFYAIDAAHMIAIVESSSERQLAWNSRALSFAENSTNPKAQEWSGSLYNNIGWTYHGQGDYHTALEIFEKAVRFREKRSDPEALRIAKWSVARTLRSLKQYSEALSLQTSLEHELDFARQKDGYVYEELAELYLQLLNKEKSAYYFKLAYTELSKDSWLVANEASRLERMKSLAADE